MLPSPIGLIPAAGYATRMQPLVGSKELVQVAGRPVIDYIVDRMLQAGCEEIRIVTRPDKEDVIDYTRSLRLNVVVGHPPDVSHSLMLGIEDLRDDAVVLIGFPDTIWEPEDGYRRLIERLEPDYEASLGLFWFDEPERADTVTFIAGEVTRVDVKHPDPTTNWIWGCAVARKRALDRLGGFPDPGSLFDALARDGKVSGTVLSKTYADIGTRAALADAARRETSS